FALRSSAALHGAVAVRAQAAKESQADRRFMSWLSGKRRYFFLSSSTTSNSASTTSPWFLRGPLEEGSPCGAAAGSSAPPAAAPAPAVAFLYRSSLALWNVFCRSV